MGLSPNQVSRAATGRMPQSLVVTTAPGSSTKEALYQLQVQSGPEGAQFGVEYVLPTWPTNEAGFGSPLEDTSVSLSGTGSVRTVAAPQPKPALKFGCYRGGSRSLFRRYWIEMPANSTSTLIIHVKGTYPAWPQTRFGLSISTFTVEDPLPNELSALADINVPGLMPKGTRIEMKAQGKAGTLTTPLLVGRTFPPFRYARIALRAILLTRSGSAGLSDWVNPQPPAVSLGAVQTDSRGRFRVSPHRVTARGRYTVIARSEARGKRAADWNCGEFFTVE